MLPPYLSDRPRPLAIALVVVGALIGGVFLGLALGWSEGWWLVANVVLLLGGVAAGLEHHTPRGGALRGVVGGLLVAVGLLIVRELRSNPDAAEFFDPPALFLIVSPVIGALLGLAGVALRRRLSRTAGEAG